MALYIKTNFDTTLRKLDTKIIQFSKTNNDFISTEDFQEFADLENTGIFNIKINPLEIKKWYSILPKETQEKNFFIVWSNGWVSIPGKTVEHFSLDNP